MSRFRAQSINARQGLSEVLASNIDRIIDGIDSEFFSDLTVYEYLRSRFNEKKNANNPEIEMKFRVHGRLHQMKQQVRGVGIRRANSEEREDPPPVIVVAPTPSSIGGMFSGLLGGTGSL